MYAAGIWTNGLILRRKDVRGESFLSNEMMCKDGCQLFVTPRYFSVQDPMTNFECVDNF